MGVRAIYLSGSQSAQGSQRSQSSQHAQSGVALIFILLFLTLGTAAYMVKQSYSQKLKVEGQSHQRGSLKQIQDALIGYAIQNPIPGKFPCPDTDGDGREDTDNDSACDLRQGWIPYVDLDLPVLLDSSQERYWYGVDPSIDRFNHTPLQDMVEDDLMLNLDAEKVAAVIIAPQERVEGQGSRAVTSDVNIINIMQHYLEAANSDTSLVTFSSKAESADQPFNDITLAITLEALQQTIYGEEGALTDQQKREKVEEAISNGMSLTLNTCKATPTCDHTRAFQEVFINGHWYTLHKGYPLADAIGIVQLKGISGVDIAYGPNEVIFTISESCTFTYSNSSTSPVTLGGIDTCNTPK